MKITTVRAALALDAWCIEERHLESGPSLLRYRKPVLGPQGIGGYSRVLRVLWPYAEESTGAMPSSVQSEAMGAFEDRLCFALEHDAHAYLAAVLTFDGARQWVFYTGNIAECGRRLEAMPQESEPYPIELDAFDDDKWEYLLGLIKNASPTNA